MAYLFKGVRQKFIDAILGVARIELFMPQARPCRPPCILFPHLIIEQLIQCALGLPQSEALLGMQSVCEVRFLRLAMEAANLQARELVGYV